MRVFIHSGDTEDIQIEEEPPKLPPSSSLPSKKYLVWCFGISRSSGSKFIGLVENNYDKYCIFFVWSFFVWHKSTQLDPVRFLFKIIFSPF